MKVEEFFAKYEEDEQMMGQIIEASKDENTLREFLSSHGVAVEPADRKKELRDEEMSEVSGGNSSHELTQCVLSCIERYGEQEEYKCQACIAECRFYYMRG